MKDIPDWSPWEGSEEDAAVAEFGHGLRCTGCRTIVDEDDLHCTCCGTRVQTGEDLTRSSTKVMVFRCSGCGASMSFTAEVGALHCPFCDETRIDPVRSRELPTPSRVVPFATEPAAIRERAARRGKSRLSLAIGLARPSSCLDIQQVFVPCWVFRGETESHWAAEYVQELRRGVPTWRAECGERRVEHADVYVVASSQLDSIEIEGMIPFDPSAGRPPSADLPGPVPAELFGMTRREARDRARERLERIAREGCERQVRGMEVKLRSVTRIRALRSEPLLLPVWILAMQDGEQRYRLVANGQTGAFGDDLGNEPDILTWLMSNMLWVCLLVLATAVGLLVLLFLGLVMLVVLKS